MRTTSTSIGAVQVEGIAMRFFIENFGCQMNEQDTEKMASVLRSRGLVQAGSLQEAELVIVNTCCVREKAEQKFYSLMGRLQAAKRKRPLLLGVTGCIAQLEKQEIVERLPFIDFALGPSAVHKVGEAVEEAERNRVFLDFSENGCTTSLDLAPEGRSGAAKAYVTIMKGCDNFCSYCIVPFVRGREISRPSGDVIEEIKGLAAAGIREVTLLGQNVNSYNKEKDDLSFPELLEAIDKVEGITRIRFVTSHPRDLSPELIDCFGRLGKLCESIHLPFQSGSDKVLRLMNRGYTVREYLERVTLLRSRCSDVAITADCIVGFPGEDENAFEETLNLVSTVRFDGLFSFAYSPRKQTRALTLPETVDRETAMERLRRLQALQRIITLEKNRAIEGKTLEVLVEGLSRNSPHDLTGRTRTGKIVNFRGDTSLLGKLVEVRITKGYPNSLRGDERTSKEA
jgi:tRNA-2-methylthio-N6-dimethylallyladenosine synthase